MNAKTKRCTECGGEMVFTEKGHRFNAGWDCGECGKAEDGENAEDDSSAKSESEVRA